MLQQNAILCGLDDAWSARVLEHGSIVRLALRQKIYEPERLIRDVYFPLDAILSIVSRMRDGQQIEIGTIGREGTSGFPLLLGASSTANDCYCQVPGLAIKFGIKLFRELGANEPGVRRRLDRYVQAYINLLGQLAACNRLHSIYERCARWLLMSHDRVLLDDIPLTHEYLAMMLGTGRSGVTIAIGTLQQAGFIRSAHGTIAIVDRIGLEAASCECYDVARAQFGGLLRGAGAGEPG
jgi:CRP-like cAMP-binding protein